MTKQMNGEGTTRQRKDGGNDLWIIDSHQKTANRKLVPSIGKRYRKSGTRKNDAGAKQKILCRGYENLV